MEVQLKRFDIKEIKDDKVVVLIGKRDTGKSFLCKDILSHHTGIPAGQVISGTEAANSFFLLKRKSDLFSTRETLLSKICKKACSILF